MMAFNNKDNAAQARGDMNYNSSTAFAPSSAYQYDSSKVQQWVDYQGAQTSKDVYNILHQFEKTVPRSGNAQSQQTTWTANPQLRGVGSWDSRGPPNA